MSMIFLSKYQAFGNDFLILGGDQLPPGARPAFSRTVCHRQLGVGADGCVFVDIAGLEATKLQIFNQDGSEAEMSGNGARCAAAHLLHKCLADGEVLSLMTAAGPRTFKLLEHAYPAWRFRSSMGRPDFSPRSFSFGPGFQGTEVRSHVLEVLGETVRIDALWVGNPQCVVFARNLPEDELFNRLGHGLATHRSFEKGTNVSFVQALSPHKVKIRIWERGVGPTHSSGTGCCGAAVAAMSQGLVSTPVEVLTEGGTQVVHWTSGEEILLDGDARFVADIHFEWPA